MQHYLIDNWCLIMNIVNHSPNEDAWIQSNQTTLNLTY